MLKVRRYAYLLLLALSACSSQNLHGSFNPRAIELETRCYEFLQEEKLNYSSECFFMLAELDRPDLAAFGLGILAMTSGSIHDAKLLFAKSCQLGLGKGLMGLAVAEEMQGNHQYARQLYEQYLLLHPDSVQGIHNFAQHLKFNARREGDLVLAERLLSRAFILNQEQGLKNYYEQQSAPPNDTAMR
jgi:tetratricopeptide (TPR) repeat protein